MRRLLLALAALICLPSVAEAATRAVIATGSWASASTWGASCGAATSGVKPTAADDVVLCPGFTVTVPCNEAAVLLTLTDDASWTATSTGGLTTATGCTAGQVPTFSFSATGTANLCGDNGSSSACASRLDGMGSTATFNLTGSSITTDAPWGEISSKGLVENCNGTNIGPTTKLGGITWPTASSDCSVYTWANQPYLAAKPAGFSALAAGNLIWFTTGQYRNNWAVVLTAPGAGGLTADELRIGFADPADGYGTGFIGGLTAQPAANPANHVSLAQPMITSLTAWTVTAPNRIKATVSAATLQGFTTGATLGHGQRAGQCLVTSPHTATKGSGKYYRIASSEDGGAGTDSLILDPWQEVAEADLAAAYLAIASNAWITPCVKPGDRWYAFEPVVVIPATPASHYSNFMFVGGLCPTLNRVWMPFGSYAGDAGGATYGAMTNPVVGFYGQRGCTVDGPFAIGPVRQGPNSVIGYSVEIENTQSFTLKNTSVQGDYWTTSPAQANHGISYLDSTNLVLDGNNVSFINNDAFYHHTVGEEGSGGQTNHPSNEGLSITIKNSSAHDIILAAALSDRAKGIAIQHDNTVGSISWDIHDNLIWNVDGGIALSNGDATQIGVGKVYSNVIGPLHRINEANVIQQAGIDCIMDGGGSSPTAYIANNVLLTSADYAPTDSTLNTLAIGNCAQVQYNYIGEWARGILPTTTAPTTGLYLYGNLIEGAGASVSATNTTSSIYGLDIQRTVDWAGPFKFQNNVLRRFCGIGGGSQRVDGMNLLGTASTTALAEIDISYNSFGMFCCDAATLTASTDSAGIYAQGANFFSQLAAGSEIRGNMFVVGDTTFGADAYEVNPMRLRSNLTNADAPCDGCTAIDLTLGQNLCSECVAGANTCPTTNSPCANSSDGTGYTHEANSLSLDIAPIRQMESLGIRAPEDLRLTRGGTAFGLTPGTLHVGASYAGIISYSQAMEDADIPPDFIRHVATDGDEPDASFLPSSMRFLLDLGGGRSLIRPCISPDCGG